MNPKITLTAGLTALLVGLGLAFFAVVLESSQHTVISSVGNVQESATAAGADSRRVATLAVQLNAARPVTDAEIAEGLNAVAVRATGGDVEALGVLLEIARLQHAQLDADAP